VVISLAKQMDHLGHSNGLQSVDSEMQPSTLKMMVAILSNVNMVSN
jgi:hypothetical protein